MLLRKKKTDEKEEDVAIYLLCTQYVFTCGVNDEKKIITKKYGSMEIPLQFNNIHAYKFKLFCGFVYLLKRIRRYSWVKFISVYLK